MRSRCTIGLIEARRLALVHDIRPKLFFWADPQSLVLLKRLLQGDNFAAAFGQLLLNVQNPLLDIVAKSASVLQSRQEPFRSCLDFLLHIQFVPHFPQFMLDFRGRERRIQEPVF